MHRNLGGSLRITYLHLTNSTFTTPLPRNSKHSMTSIIYLFIFIEEKSECSKTHLVLSFGPQHNNMCVPIPTPLNYSHTSNANTLLTP